MAVIRDTLVAADCGMAQLVARLAHNQKVVGANPTPATNF